VFVDAIVDLFLYTFEVVIEVDVEVAVVVVCGYMIFSGQSSECATIDFPVRAFT